MLPIARIIVAAVLVGSAVVGCSNSTSSTDGATPSASDALSPASFTLEFTRIAPSGYIDMSLDVSNPYDTPVVLSGELVALDADGNELHDVTVTTAFGFERGAMVIMPGGGVDFVQLRGPDAAQVRQIALTNVRAVAADAPVITQPIDVTPLNAHGKPLDYALGAVSVRVENPNDVAVRVRVVLLVLEPAQQGVPQQASAVRDVATVDVAANGSTDVELQPSVLQLIATEGTTSFVSLRPVLAP